MANNFNATIVTTCDVVGCVGDEVKVVSTPPFAESVTEGDIKWNKGETVSHLLGTVVTC